MSSDDVYNRFDTLDTSTTPIPSEALDFLNSSDNENELSDPPRALNNSNTEKNSEDDSMNEDAPSLTLSITNVVVMASMRCHLRLKDIARSSVDVEYKALQNHVIMRIRSPYTVATIWSSGKIWCTGANSLAKAKIGARRVARRIAKCGFPCRFSRFKVVNIMANCHLPFRVRLEELVKEKPMMMSYEPELAPGLTFKTDRNSSTSLKLFSTGRIVIMGSSLDAISALVEELVPLAALHQTDEPVSDSDADEEHQKAEFRVANAAAQRMVFLSSEFPIDGFGYVDDELEDPDADEFASDSDSSFNAPSRYRIGTVYSTDDSTDSGASIDSGGISTRPKRRRKRRTTRAHTNAKSNLTNSVGQSAHLLTTREAVSLSFAKRASGEWDEARGLVATAADVRRQHDLGVVPPPVSSAVTTKDHSASLYDDPMWSRKAVSSGSKRASVVHYSGTGESEANDVVISGQQPQSNVRAISSVAPPITSVNPTVATVLPSCISTTTLIPQHYVVTQTVADLGQSVQSHGPAALPHGSTYSTSPVTPRSQPQVIRIATQNTVVAPSPMTLANPVGSNVSSGVYPIRLSGTVQPAIIPSMGPKIVNVSPNNSAPTQFVNFSPIQTAQTYQVYQPNMLVGSQVFSTTGGLLQSGTATFVSGGNSGVLVNGIPANMGSAVIQQSATQSMPQFYPTYLGQTQTRLP